MERESEQIGVIVSQALSRNGWTHERLAEELGISAATLYRLKSRSADGISLALARKLYCLAGVSLAGPAGLEKAPNTGSQLGTGALPNRVQLRGLLEQLLGFREEGDPSESVRDQLAQVNVYQFNFTAPPTSEVERDVQHETPEDPDIGPSSKRRAG